MVWMVGFNWGFSRVDLLSNVDSTPIRKFSWFSMSDHRFLQYVNAALLIYVLSSRHLLSYLQSSHITAIIVKLPL